MLDVGCWTLDVGHPPFAMTVFGLGVDIVEIARLAAAVERQGRPLLDRCFLPAEQEYCDRHSEPVRFYAARFAVKEAVAKALGTGIGAELSWLDMEVRHKATGAPFLLLHGAGAETAKRLGIRDVMISISHSEHYAVANALAMAAE
jgi:holo-[acyl-carrier protein] synthase